MYVLRDKRCVLKTIWVNCCVDVVEIWNIRLRYWCREDSVELKLRIDWFMLKRHLVFAVDFKHYWTWEHQITPTPMHPYQLQSPATRPHVHLRLKYKLGRGSHVNDRMYIMRGYQTSGPWQSYCPSQSFFSRQVSFLFGITESKSCLFPEFDVVTLGSEGYTVPLLLPRLRKWYSPWNRFLGKGWFDCITIVGRVCTFDTYQQDISRGRKLDIQQSCLRIYLSRYIRNSV